jgi:hypothetical protein
MNRWTAGACVAFLAGCAGPQISVTEASARRVGFLVQNARLVPLQDVDEQAADYCRQRGRASRRTEAVWVGPALKRVVYECDLADQRPTPNLEVRRMPTASAKPKTAPDDDLKVAAWAKARAATDQWALCLGIDAERRAKETTEEPLLVAREVVSACSGLERAVHGPLAPVGEASARFEADLHAQAVQKVSDAVTSIRQKTDVKKTDVSISRFPAF